MGLFMSMSGVIGVSSEKVFEVLADYVAEEKGQLDYCEAVNMEDPYTGVITKGLPNTTIVYPGDFMEWEESSCALSQRLSAPVFSFHIHDGDFWMYHLYHKGEQVDQFLPLPEYWGEIGSEEKEAVKGDAQRVASVISNLNAESIKIYLAEWDVHALGENKAYSDDEYAIGDCWQICDFMKKVGLEYPVDDNGQIKGKAFKIIFKENKRVVEKPKAQKPWWKFW